MAAFAPANRIRGRIGSYDVATIEDVDRELLRLTTAWSELAKLSPPTAKMRSDYRHDCNLLLDARARLQLPTPLVGQAPFLRRHGHGEPDGQDHQHH